ncbi:MAG: hypothetical protein KY432_03125 [Acidobacteria bacterium]|nr:hypothetical protein [Acidobacteriota bacterium]
MWKLARSSGVVVVVALAAILLHAWVYTPYRQNEMVRIGMDDSSAAAHTLRRTLQLLERHQPWDPYLRGWGGLAEARVLRKLGRSDAAREKYLEALASRLPHEHWVELGLYEWELGLNREAEAHLRFAIGIHPGLLRDIHDGHLRRQLEAMFSPAAE